MQIKDSNNMSAYQFHVLTIKYIFLLIHIGDLDVHYH